ncbi:MAG: DUF262 domain-containing protein [Ekhidna sp.]|nr:DUF262 domain-containing protein [Ekhidna sp.]
MEVELKEITVRDLCEGYEDNGDDGVVGYGGKLDIRPPYQREFVYRDKQREAVIDTIGKGFPLNVMYWAVRDDGSFEIIDGQQRTISIAQYVTGDFSVKGLYFNNVPLYFHALTSDQKEKILNYKLMIYQCSGTDSEKLEWFKTINIAGEKLTNQELRNAVYAGSWTTNAKRYFSKSSSAAYRLGSDYLTGSPIRQEYLETAIKWLSKGKIENYMARHQHDPDAKELWAYFESVIGWVKKTFPKKRKEMKGVEWGYIYDKYSNETYDPDKLEVEIHRLMEDEDVTSKKGIYEYLLSGDEHHLNIRTFTEKQKREMYERQGGKCAITDEAMPIDKMEADHIIAWRDGGKTTLDNLQMVSKQANRRKGVK